MKVSILIAAATLLPLAALGQKKEQFLELQRDVSLLRDDFRSFQTAQNEKLAQLDILIRQAIEAANKANTAVAVLQSGINDRLSEQNKTVGGTVAGFGSKVDTLADEMRTVRESLADLTSRLGRLDQKVTDLTNIQRTLATPAVPPPGDSTTGGPAGAPSGPAPSASATYENAVRDYSGGRNDLALQEFQEYLKWFSNTDLAPNAQYYIGDIYLRQGDHANAIKAFDTVLEKYSDNKMTADAHYMKAVALLQSGQKTAAGKEYCEVIRRYPSNPLASKAKSALKGMGLSPGCGVASAPAKRRRR